MDTIPQMLDLSLPYHPQLLELRHKLIDSMRHGEWPFALIEKLQTTSLDHWYRQILELEFLRPLLEKENLQEIIFHSYQLLQIDQEGVLYSIPIQGLDRLDYQLIQLSLPLRYHLTCNFSKPFLSFQLILCDRPVRATLIHPSLSPYQQGKLFIRKFYPRPLPLEAFQFPPEVIHKLNEMIERHANFIICGPTNSGKTTLLRSLLYLMAQDEHIVIMEDTHEIFLLRKEVTHLLVSNSNQTLEQFCSYALRLRPDRIILGEIRSSEIIPFMLTMNNGHGGMATTLHACTAHEAIKRLATLWSHYSTHKIISYETIHELLEQAIDYIIVLEQRKVVSYFDIKQKKELLNL